MRLTLENIAKVRKADVEINGITVIAGENNTGKSTVGKALYSVFNSLYHVENQIREERVKTITNHIERLTIQINRRFIDLEGSALQSVAERIVADYYEQKGQEVCIKETLSRFLWKNDKPEESIIEGKEVKDFICKVKEILEVSDDVILKTVLKNKLNSEFNRQINNVYNDEAGNISLDIRKKQIRIVISENSVKEVQTPISLQTEPV